LFKRGSTVTSAAVEGIDHRIDVNTQVCHGASELGLNDIGSVRLALGVPLVFDTYEENRQTGGFILIDKITNNTVAAGMITGSTQKEAKEAGGASEFEVEFNALVRRHFPHWNAGMVT
jgi:sulfate adenylyltransferase subunit 1